VAIKLHQPEATVSRIVLEVRRFVEFHFISEENLMIETGYPGAEAHQTVHRELLAELNAKMAKLHSHREYPEDLLDFLVRWLLEHIAHHDQHVARHARSSAERPVAELIYAEYLLPPAPGP
jgi:hemerythrin-like metal-binding protein